MGMKPPKHEPDPPMPGVCSSSKDVGEVPHYPTLASQMKDVAEEVHTMSPTVLVSCMAKPGEANSEKKNPG